MEGQVSMTISMTPPAPESPDRLSTGDEVLERFAVRVAAAACRALHRHVMTYILSKESRMSPGWIEIAEVELPLIAPNSFDVFDDPDVVSALAFLNGERTALLAEVARLRALQEEKK